MTSIVIIIFESTTPVKCRSQYLTINYDIHTSHICIQYLFLTNHLSSHSRRSRLSQNYRCRYHYPKTTPPLLQVVSFLLHHHTHTHTHTHIYIYTCTTTCIWQQKGHERTDNGAECPHCAPV